jgi:hypothetical protein
MKRSLADGAGYLVIDHRNSPGTSEVPEGTVRELDVMQCSHCQRTVVLNPGRVRARAVCPKCHHFICDSCETTRVASGGACVPFKAVLDRAQALAEKFVGQPDHPDATINPEALRQESAPIVAVPDGPSIVLTDT